MSALQVETLQATSGGSGQILRRDAQGFSLTGEWPSGQQFGKRSLTLSVEPNMVPDAASGAKPQIGGGPLACGR